jgi:hypothetical protein
MKNLLSLLAALLFVSGVSFAQTKPASSSAAKTTLTTSRTQLNKDKATLKAARTAKKSACPKGGTHTPACQSAEKAVASAKAAVKTSHDAVAKAKAAAHPASK